MTDSSPFSPNRATNPLRGPNADRMSSILAEGNPGAGRNDIELAGKATAALTRVGLKLSSEQRRRLVDDATLEALVKDAVAQALDVPNPRHGQRAEHRALDTIQGDGLGPLLSLEDGSRRLQVVVEPCRIEQWAGPVAGSTGLQRELGIARSTLQAWRQQRAVIGLLAGLKKEVFPLAQFIDARPVRGLAQLLEVIGDPRMAWLWLITPHPELNGAQPLDRLKRGSTDEVFELARADHGQP